MSLLRSIISSPPLRAGKRRAASNVNMPRRKQLRRISKINYFSKQYTGQQLQNQWLIPKRLKALGLHMEQMRNAHPGTVVIADKVKDDIAKIFVDDSHWQYYVYRNEAIQIQQEKIHRASCQIDDAVKMLPSSLRKEVQTVQPPTESPQILDPNCVYLEQYQKYMPDQLLRKYVLAQMLEYPPKATLGGGLENQ